MKNTNFRRQPLYLLLNNSTNRLEIKRSIEWHATILFCQFMKFKDLILKEFLSKTAY